MAEDLARQTQLQGVMLTTLKGNHGACKFYEAKGYVPSALDPTLVAPERASEFDYRILVKLF